MFGPLVLFYSLLLLLGGEVVLDVEELANLLDGLVLDHAGDLGAGKLKQRLDIEVVGGHDELEEHLLLHVNVVCVPGVDDGGHVGVAEWLLDLGDGVVLDVSAKLNNLFEYGALDIGEGDLLFGARIVDDALDEHGLFGYRDLNLDFFTITAE